jgi:hypothetical protein
MASPGDACTGCRHGARDKLGVICTAGGWGTHGVGAGQDHMMSSICLGV